jgi:hypothetical protein
MGMTGKIPVSGDLTMEGLAATLNRNEDDFTQLTALGIDPNPNLKRNGAEFIPSSDLLGPLTICPKGETAQGTKIISTTAYVSGVQTEIDVYRLTP